MPFAKEEVTIPNPRKRGKPWVQKGKRKILGGEGKKSTSSQ